MNQKNPGRTRQRKDIILPTQSQITRERARIQSGWSTREKQRRRVDQKHAPHQPHDSRTQAQLRFIKFLLELEAQSK